MSTHTTHYCDACNSDHDTQHTDGRSAVNYSEMPTYEGWSEFNKPYIDRWGDRRMSESHICVHCLADPEFDQSRYGEIAEWDAESRENFEKGRKHAEAFAWAQEHLGTPDRWGMRGVRQVFDEYGYGYQPGPKLADGRFRTSDEVRQAA